MLQEDTFSLCDTESGEASVSCSDSSSPTLLSDD